MAILVIWGIVLATLPILLSSAIYFTVLISDVIFNLAIGLSQANLYGMLVPSTGDTPNTLQAFFFSSTPEVQAFYLSLIAIVLAILFGALVWETVKKVFSWSFLNSTDNNNTWNWREIPKWFLIALATLVFVPGVILVLQMATGLVGDFILDLTTGIQDSLNLDTLIGVDATARITSLQWQMTAIHESFRSMDGITIGGATGTFRNWLETFNTADKDVTGLWLQIKQNLKETITNLNSWTAADSSSWATIATTTQSSFNSFVKNWNIFTGYITLDGSDHTNVFWNTLLGKNTEEFIKTWNWEEIMNTDNIDSLNAYLGATLVLPTSTFWSGSNLPNNTDVLAGILGANASSTVLTAIEKSGAVFTKGTSLGFNTILFSLNLSDGSNHSFLGIISSNKLLTNGVVFTSFEEFLNMDLASAKTEGISRIFSSLPDGSSPKFGRMSPWVLFVHSFIWPVVDENGTASFTVNIKDFWGSIFFQVIAVFFLWYGVKMFFKFGLYAALRIIQIFWSFILAIGWAFYGWKDSEPYQQQLRNIFGYVVAILGLLFSLYLFTFAANLIITGQLVGLGVKVNGINVFDHGNILYLPNGDRAVMETGAVFNDRLWIVMIAGLIMMITIQKQFEKIPDMITQKLKLEQTYQQAADGLYQDSIGTFKAIRNVGGLALGAGQLVGKNIARGGMWTLGGIAKMGAKSSLKRSGVWAGGLQRASENLRSQTKDIGKDFNPSSMQKFKSTGPMRGLTSLGTMAMGSSLYKKAGEIYNGGDGGFKKYNEKKNNQKQIRANENFLTDSNGEVVYNQDGYKQVSVTGLANKSQVKKDVKTLSDARPNLIKHKGTGGVELHHTKQDMENEEQAVRSVTKTNNFSMEKQQKELGNSPFVRQTKNADNGTIVNAFVDRNGFRNNLMNNVSSKPEWKSLDDSAKQDILYKYSRGEQMSDDYGISNKTIQDYNRDFDAGMQVYNDCNDDLFKVAGRVLEETTAGKLFQNHYENKMSAIQYNASWSEKRDAKKTLKSKAELANQQTLSSQNAEKLSSLGNVE